jgi:hypothetical protein
MTPHRNSRKTKSGERVASGSLVIDVRIRHVGRVHRATGIHRENTFALFKAAVKEMGGHHSGREWIRMFQRGDIDGVELFAAYNDGRWRELPKPELEQPLVKALEEWQKATKGQVAAETHRVRAHLVTKVREYAPAAATVNDLPAVLRAMRGGMGKAAASFNLLRNYVRAFVRDTIGKRNPVYEAIKFDVLPIPIPGHAKQKEKKRHPLTPAQVQLLASKFSTVAAGGGKQEGHGYVAIMMALTGTHPEEFWGEWEQAPTYVHVHGTKREPRDRKIPKLFPTPLWPHPVLKRSTITVKSFGRAFRAAAKEAKLTCSPLDMRRSFANWLEAAGIERTRRRMYMGHGGRDVTDLYETQELLQHLAKDGEKLRTWIKQQLDLAQRPQLVKELSQ